MAATPGRVVFRNELIELIAYEPQTPTVHAAPLLCSPPWINKYYIMDLAPNRWLHRVGGAARPHDVRISYRNPDASMRDFGMDDYLSSGLLSALDAVRRSPGRRRSNLVSLCLGGTMTIILLAYLAAHGEADASAPPR